jgi:holo-[acyl-carrier protein] synthase
MVSGIGIDLVEVATVTDSIQEYGNSYLERMFTRQEIEYCGGMPISFQCYAGRIAVKEAAMKALSTGWGQGVEWLDLEVVNEPSGQPSLQVSGKAAQLFEQRGISRIWVSISHVPEYAVAQVVLES